MAKTFEALQKNLSKEHSRPPDTVLPAIQDTWRDLYKTLTEIGFIPSEDGAITLVFTSAYLGEGVTTVAVNSAAALCEDPENRVLLIDANYRDPTLSDSSAIVSGAGFADVAAGRAILKDAIVHNSRGYYVLSAGHLDQSPTAFFRSPLFERAVTDMGQDFDYILFDSAPVNEYPETAVMAAKLKGAILVVHSEKTKWDQVRAAKNSLEQANVKVLGAVLNRKRIYLPRTIDRQT